MRNTAGLNVGRIISCPLCFKPLSLRDGFLCLGIFSIPFCSVFYLVLLCPYPHHMFPAVMGQKGSIKKLLVRKLLNF